MNEKEEEIQRIERENKIVKKPNDLLSIYMENRNNLSSEGSFHLSYMILLSLIDMGKEMLPNSESALRNKAEKILMDEKSYPSSREMNISAGFYRLGAGSTKIGQIIVRPEDLDSGIAEMQNQQAMKIIPSLKQIDSQIFQSLVKYKIVTVKKPSLKDEIMSGFIEDFKPVVKEE